MENITLKETVSVISIDPPGKDDNTRFTTVPLTALSEQVLIRKKANISSTIHDY